MLAPPIRAAPTKQRLSKALLSAHDKQNDDVPEERLPQSGGSSSPMLSRVVAPHVPPLRIPVLTRSACADLSSAVEPTAPEQQGADAEVDDAIYSRHSLASLASLRPSVGVSTPRGSQPSPSVALPRASGHEAAPVPAPRDWRWVAPRSRSSAVLTDRLCSLRQQLAQEELRRRLAQERAYELEQRLEDARRAAWRGSPRNKEPRAPESFECRLSAEAQQQAGISKPSPEERDAVLAGVSAQGIALAFAPEALRADRDVLLAAIQSNGRALRFASCALKQDRELLIAALKQLGIELCEELPTIRDVALEAVQRKHFVLDLLADTFKADREIVLKAVEKHGHALRFAASSLKFDREVLLTAFRQLGIVLPELNMQSQTIRELVLCAVRQKHFVLDLVADTFKMDRQAVHAAVAGDGRALRFAADALKFDRKLLFAAMQQAWNISPPDSLQTIREVVLWSVRSQGETLYIMADTFKSDRDVVMESVRSSGLSLQHSADALKADRDVVFAAVSNNGRALRFAAAPLKDDCGLLSAAFKQAWGIDLPEHDCASRRDMALGAARIDGSILEVLSDSLKADVDIAFAAVRQSPDALRHVARACLRYEDVVLAASHASHNAAEGDTTTIAAEPISVSPQGSRTEPPQRDSEQKRSREPLLLPVGSRDINLLRTVATAAVAIARTRNMSENRDGYRLSAISSPTEPSDADNWEIPGEEAPEAVEIWDAGKFTKRRTVEMGWGSSCESRDVSTSDS